MVNKDYQKLVKVERLSTLGHRQQQQSLHRSRTDGGIAMSKHVPEMKRARGFCNDEAAAGAWAVAAGRELA